MRSGQPESPAVGGFPDDAFTWLASIEPGHFWFEERNRLIMWALRRYGRGARSLLEVGCGTGFVLQAIRKAFPDLALTGTDALPGGLAIAGQRVPDATLLQEDARDLRAQDAFDAVSAFDVLEHIPEDEEVLLRLHAAAKPNGIVLITVPQHPALWSRADEAGHHVRRYRRRELVDKVTRGGFTPLRVTSFVSVLLPLLAVSRWIEGRAPDAAIQRETQPSPAVNALLRFALTVERSAIRAGLSWPAGGSLLMVGRRSPRPGTR